jgi:cell wall-associated NlpC family hydrolase
MALPFPGNCASPKATAAWMASVAEYYDLPGILPVMCSCVELTGAWTSEGCLEDVPGFLEAQDYDSVGLFQQRPSQGWGTVQECIDPPISLVKFLEEANKYKGQYSYTNPDELGQWCQAVQRSGVPDAYRSKGYPMALELLKDWQGEVTMVTAQDLIATGRQMMGSAYEQWDGTWPPSAGAPFWMIGDVSVDLVLKYGCNCSGFLNAILRLNGLPAAGGTGSIGDYLIDLQDFDVSTPAVPGALALRPWSGGVGDLSEGHVALYTGAHSLLQADHRGVNELDTDTVSQSWAGFTVYGLLPNVDYSPAPVEPNEELWRKYGWWTYESESSWNLKFYPPVKEVK